MVDALERQGHQVCCFDSGKAYGQVLRGAMGLWNTLRGYPWNSVAWFSPARRQRAEAVAREADRVGADLVFCTSTLDAPVNANIPYVIWLDNTWALLDRSASALPFSLAAKAEIDRLERQALQEAAAVLPFSRHVAENVVSYYAIPAARVMPVGCGAGPMPPFEGEKSFREGHLLFVAKHLFSAKGGDLVLEAFRLVRAVRPETKLVLIGNEEARQKAAGMEGVEVHGFLSRDQLNRYFHDAAMLVQPMLSDPWGQVYLEAMKARAVVVSVNVGALPELTDDGRLAVLIDRPDARVLADAVLATYARSQVELDGMTWQAQALVLDSHGWDSVGQRTAEVLQRAMGKGTAA